MSTKECYSVAAGQLSYPPMTLSEMLRFLHHCLLLSAGCGRKGAELDRQEIALLRKYLAKLHSSDKNEAEQSMYNKQFV